MPVVRFHETRDDGTGTRAPAPGKLTFAPSRARIIPGDPDEHVLSAGFEAATDADGRLAVTLDALPAGWAWLIRRRSIPAWSGAYLVQDVPGPLDFGDLVAVDPGSLEPVAPPSDAWLAALDAYATKAELAAAVGDIEAALGVILG